MRLVCIHPYDRWMRVTKVKYFLSQQRGVHKRITDHPTKEQWQSLDWCFPLNLHWLALGSLSYIKQTHLDRKYSIHLLYCIVLWVRCHGWTATLHIYKLKSINNKSKGSTCTQFSQLNRVFSLPDVNLHVHSNWTLTSNTCLPIDSVKIKF